LDIGAARETEIDEDTDRRLKELASEYQAIEPGTGGLVLAREGMEEFAERSEATHDMRCARLCDRSEADFRKAEA